MSCEGPMETSKRAYVSVVAATAKVLLPQRCFLLFYGEYATHAQQQKAFLYLVDQTNCNQTKSDYSSRVVSLDLSVGSLYERMNRPRQQIL